MTYWDEYDNDDGGDYADDEYDEYYDDDGGDGEVGAPRRAARLIEAAVAILLAVAVVALIVGVSDGDDDGDSDEVATEEEDSTTSTRRSTTTTRPSTSTSTGDAPAASVVEGSSTTATGGGTGGSATTKRPTTTEATTPVYEDLTPACVDGGGGAATQPDANWAERWQTKPNANDPATISVCVDDVTPRVGQEITVSLVGTDPDAEFFDDECGWFVTWESDHFNKCRDFLTPTTAPRPTPPERPGRILRSTSHVYTSPGTRTITGSVVSAEYNGYTEPYSSYAEASLQVTVHG